jgi:photosystem II stability/assembly factor-like uncharacterized protein
MGESNQLKSKTLFLFLLFFFLSIQFSSSQDSNKKENWLNRWKEFEIQRLGSDGSPASPKIYLEEALKVSFKKDIAFNRSSGLNAWIPIGPSTKPTSVFHSLLVGMGRINTVAFHPSDSNIFWVGVAQGGVWKTMDGGQNWVPLTDNLPILRISDIAVNPGNPDIIYISVGDYAYLGVALDLDDRKRHTHYGLGVYKTIDGGLTWQATGLTFNQTDRDESLIRRVLIDPLDPNHLVAAGINGIFNSTNAGFSWTSVSDSLIWDLISDPSSNRNIYAATGFVKNLNQGTAGIMKSTDFGNTWTVLNTGIPGKNQVQRIKLAISPQDSNYVYALSCNMTRGFYGLYRSTDGGTSWSLRSQSPNILTWFSGGGGSSGQGTYDLSLIVEPTDKNRIYSGGINLWGSTDGGTTWDGASYWTDSYGPSIHADHHFYSYNPLNQTYYMCSDGGISKTRNIIIDGWNFVQSGNNWSTVWTDLSEMQITSFYRMGFSQNNPGYYVAGAQDNSTFYNTPVEWRNLIGGDGMDCLLHPNDPSIVYGSAQFGYLVKSTDGGVNFSYIAGDMDNSGEQSAWTTPIIMDNSNPNTLLTGFGNVWKTFDGGSNWTRLSNFPNMGTLGYPSPIVAIDFSGPSIFAASRIFHSNNEPSKMWVSTNNGTSWVNITSGLPDSLFFTGLDAVGALGQIAYVSVGGFENGKKIYKTTDAGNNWQNISMNLPNVPVNVVKYLIGSQNSTVFAGTDIGVYMSNDTMNSWTLFGTGLPNVIVSDIEIDPVLQKLYVATFGRGLWEIDLSPLLTGNENLSEFLKSLEVNLYPNPSEGALNLRIHGAEGENAKITIIDILGRERYKEEFLISEDLRFDPRLDYGKYFIRIEIKGGSLVKAFVIQG